MGYLWKGNVSESKVKFFVRYQLKKARLLGGLSKEGGRWEGHL